jgi:type IV pilus assembly protein PilC
MVDAGSGHGAIAPRLGRTDAKQGDAGLIKDVCTRVEGGDSFSDALQKHPKVFNRLYVAMVGAGRKGRFAGGNP